MRYLTLFVKIVVFLLLFAFASQNTHPATLNGLMGLKWESPLVLFLLVFFVMGAATGVLAMLVYVFRLRRDLAETKKQLRRYIDRPAPKSAAEVEPSAPLDAVV